MNILLRNLRLAFLVTFAFAFSLAQADSQDPMGRIYRTLVLSNQMRVLLVQDPKAVRSSASLSVGVGSNSDPNDALGFFHYAEHMLFLGTKSFPDAAEYKAYMDRNGGMDNAYTADDMTNYSFEVVHEAFEGALHRLSRFFVEALFTAQFSQDEKNAVNSEFSGRKNNDSIRFYETLRTAFNPKHPASQFHTGTLQTLKDMTPEGARKLIEDNYSANLMGLSLVSPKGLDEQEAYVRKYFSDIANKNLPRPTFEKIPLLAPDYVTSWNLLKSLGGDREVGLVFAIPSTLQHYRSKPLQLAASILQDPRGIERQFKREGLGTRVGAWVDETADMTLFYVGLEASKKGIEQKERIIELLWSAIRGLAKTEIPEHVFNDFRERRELAYATDATDSAFVSSKEWAAKLQQVPDLSAFPKDVLVPTHHDAQVFYDVMDQVDVSHAVMAVMAPELEPKGVEPYTGARYDLIPDHQFRQRLFETEAAKVFIPRRNPLMDKEQIYKEPKNGQRIAVTANKERVDQELILLRKYGEVFGEHDVQVREPRVALILNWMSPLTVASPRQHAAYQLYRNMILDHIYLELTDYFKAGYSIGFTNSESLSFRISGYASDFPEFVKDIGLVMAKFKPTKAQFELFREKEAQSWARASLTDEAGDQAKDELDIQLGEGTFRSPEIAEAYQRLQYGDFNEFKDEVYQNGWLFGAAYGQYSKTTLEKAIASWGKSLKLKANPHKVGLLPEPPRTLEVGAREHVKLDLENPSSAAWVYAQLGPVSTESWLKAQIFGKFFDSGIFHELRTIQQLGYSVSGFVKENNGVLELHAIADAPDYPASELVTRIHQYIPQAVEDFAKISDQEFAELKRGLKGLLEENYPDIDSALISFNRVLTWRYRDSDHQEKKLAAIDGITKSAVLEFVKAYLVGPEKAFLTIEATGANHQPKPAIMKAERCEGALN